MTLFQASLLLLLLLQPGPVNAQDDPDNYLVWQADVPLTRSDFEAPPDPDSPPYQTAGSKLTSSIQLSCTGDVPDFRVVAEFDRNSSWARPEMPDRLLRHEQLHFDIAEVYARRSRREFREIDDPCRNAAAVRAMAQRNDALGGEVQRLYDEETGHGTEPEAQADWARKVRILLFEP
jgi:hypothetical protein